MVCKISRGEEGRGLKAGHRKSWSVCKIYSDSAVRKEIRPDTCKAGKACVYIVWTSWVGGWEKTIDHLMLVTNLRQNSQFAKFV